MGLISNTTEGRIDNEQVVSRPHFYSSVMQLLRGCYVQGLGSTEKTDNEISHQAWVIGLR